MSSCLATWAADQPRYTYSTTRPSAASAPASTQPQALSEMEISQIVAPIALYPDPLISQILMASTYPLEIVQADRWAKANKALKGDALTAELEKQTWDPSVRSLVNFPDVLAALNDKLDLTIKLGDAFIAQQGDVMNTIQKLRAKAQAQGALKSNEQQKVTVEAAPTTTVVVNVDAAQTTPPTQVIKIEPTNPQTIYVPSYSPTVVYGSWPYPAYPPYYYYPPAPSYGSNLVSFGLGVACGAAWGYAWGNCNWGGNDVDIDVDRNTNINTNIDRSKYKSEIQNRQANRTGERGGAGGGRGQGSWQHNPSHRQGVPYRDSASAQKFGGANTQAAAARDSYRGRADAGRQDLSRGGANQFSGGAGSYGGANRSTGGNYSSGNRSGAGSYSSANRSGGSSAGSSSRSGGSFSGVNSGGSSARASSSRGQASRSSPSYSRSAPARSAPSRSSGGGGARGGGRGGGRR
ncbi:MAG TPA: DUF3300 domain-containing protein [Tepidisphaeraceae bacterium]|nr:DUF3300 domain-containing protein [Tepidisphaeraceae bacterium]